MFFQVKKIHWHFIELITGNVKNFSWFIIEIICKGDVLNKILYYGKKKVKTTELLLLDLAVWLSMHRLSGQFSYISAKNVMWVLVRSALFPWRKKKNINFFFQFLTFPTGSGITENTANTACKSALVDSELGKLCEPLVDTSQMVVGCVTDVLVRQWQQLTALG